MPETCKPRRTRRKPKAANLADLADPRSLPAQCDVAGKQPRRIRDLVTVAKLAETPSSKERPWGLWEHGAAWMSGRTLVTTRVGVSPAEIPVPFTFLQIHALDDVETAAEVFRALGDAGQHLAAFCEQIAAMEAAIPRPEGAPAPIQLRWHGGNLNGWNEVSRKLEVHLRAEAPVRIDQVEAFMWHRAAPETLYEAMPQSTLQVPETPGRGLDSITQTLRFNTSGIPEELHGGGTAANQICLRANVSYVDSNGQAGTIASPIHDVR